MNNFFQELKERNVYRVAVIYIVLAWAAIQVADVVVPALLLPEWSITLVASLLIIGFPLALILSWMFELSPRGIYRDPRDQNEATNSRNYQAALAISLSLIVSVGLLISISLFFPQWFTAIRYRTEPQALNPNDDIYRALTSEQPVSRLGMTIGFPQPDSGTGIRSSFDFSSDGQILVYTILQNGVKQLMARNMSELQPWSILQQEQSLISFPRLSPDDSRVLVTLANGLNVVPIGGGTPRLLTNRQQNFGAVFGWLSNDEIVFIHQDGKLRRLNLLNGETGYLIDPDTDLGVVRSIASIAERNLILLTIRENTIDLGRIAILDLATGLAKELVTDGYRPTLTPTGHLVFVRQGSLWAVSLDLETLDTVGEPRLVEAGIESHRFYTMASYALADNGRLVYMPGGDLDYVVEDVSVKLSSIEGEITELDIPIGQYNQLQVSSNAQYIAATRNFGQDEQDIWFYDRENESINRRTFGGSAHSPVFSPDSRQLYYVSSIGLEHTLWRINSDGTGQPERVYDHDRRFVIYSIAPDASHLLMLHLDRTINILKLNLNGVTSVEPYIATEFNDYGPKPSPDGRWIAYSSRETGDVHLFLRQFDNPAEGKWQISTLEEAEEAFWTQDSKTLYFRAGSEGKIYRTEMISTNPVVFSEPEPIFVDLQVAKFPDGSPYYAFLPDEQGIVYLEPANPADGNGPVSQAELVIANNWFSHLIETVSP